MQSILQQAQGDPAALQEHMKNAGIKSKIQVCLNLTSFLISMLMSIAPDFCWRNPRWTMMRVAKKPSRSRSSPVERLWVPFPAKSKTTGIHRRATFLLLCNICVCAEFLASFSIYGPHFNESFLYAFGWGVILLAF